jgi:hypothetical protein
MTIEHCPYTFRSRTSLLKVQAGKLPGPCFFLLMKSIVCLKKSMTRLVSVRLISPFWIIINGLALPNPQPRGSKYVQYQYMYTIYIYMYGQLRYLSWVQVKMFNAKMAGLMICSLYIKYIYIIYICDILYIYMIYDIYI